MITRNLKYFIETITVDTRLEDIFNKDQDVLEGIEENIASQGGLTGEAFYINVRPDGTEVLLDGHTRRQACLNQVEHIKEDAQVVVIVLSLLDVIAEELWIRTHQIKRRNLSNTQSNENKLAIGRLYNQSKKEIGRPNQLNKSGQLTTLNNTSQKLSKELGIGEKTIRRYAKLNDQIEEMAENLAPKKLTDDENDKKAYKEKIATHFTSGKISGATLDSMSKVSGSPLHKDKVKKALKAEDINTTWKALKSKPLAPPSPPSSQRDETDDLIQTKEALEKLLNNSSDEKPDASRASLSGDDVNTSSYNSVKNKIKLLTEQPEFKEDGETPTDTAIFLYEIRCLTSDYFRNRINAFNIIKNKMNS